MNAPLRTCPPLGTQLVAMGLVTQDQLNIALREQRHTGTLLGKTLVSLGFVSEAVLRDALAQNLGHACTDLTRVIANPAALRLIPKEMAKRLQVLPLAVNADTGKIVLAMAHPDDLVTLDLLYRHLGNHHALEPLLAGESELAEAIDRHYGHELSIDGILHEIETGEIDWSSIQSSSAGYSQPVVRLIDALLADAVACEASDLHFEPEQGFVRIRYRIDGVLRQIRALHRAYWPAMAVRLKVMANMNIAETRAPQDGRITLALAGRPLDFRVSVQPTTWGENIVLRILDRLKGLMPLDGLGLTAEAHDLLQRMISRPEGILLVTGPTGSGKTTTLYSILSHLNSPAINIMTLEDPVEYPLPFIRQTSVNDAVKLDFASGIRSMMRQDPDVILVGEIRDRDTAEMALRAAMTGHQVHATLHTHSAIGAIPRLLDLGIRPDILAGNIIGIVAQRLLRRLCPHCRMPDVASDLECRLLGQPEAGGAIPVFRASGCPHCGYTGYRGRLAVMELLKMDADLDDLLARRATPHELLQTARSKGLRPLADDACRRVLSGETSLEEAARVVDLSGRTG
ncbi:type IV pilus assembly protein PilB [Formivibrio citricus]|uniref:Type IV pilus assembly protein PilB n=1 Tax=Formivibrio citricus TaxID=83765 RepID=A0A1I5DE76_9NEIS|nr:GspE/PulE family protein [Formivibrio citricus]SFN97111.1 type IV pilus assembly protein PilB [Formivibrio citricus]